jgi:hypothetical protein
MKKAQAEKLFEKVRTLALALPEAKEVEAWGHPTFRAPKKMFAAAWKSRGRARDSHKRPQPVLLVVLSGKDQHRTALGPDLRGFK